MDEPLRDFNSLDLVDTSDIHVAQVEQWIGKTLCAELVKHYPNRNWAAAVDSGNGVVAIMETDISKEKGYVLHLTRSMDELRTMMKRVGGEILERAGLPTGKKFDPDLLEDLPRNVRDEVVTDDLETPEEARVRTESTRSG